MRQQVGLFIFIGPMMGVVVMLGGTMPTVGEAQTTTRVSVAPGGGQAHGDSVGAAISADGRFVAFASEATNLVPGDTNSRADVFVHDRQTGTTSRVSVATGGEEANGTSGDPAISADGRVVAFWSWASNLVPGDTNSRADVFVHDRQTGTTSRVNVATGGEEANGDSGIPAVSADGRVVAFSSEATNLVPGDTNNATDVFVHDRQTGTTSRVSVATGGGQANGASGHRPRLFDGGARPAVSADGRVVAFSSEATNLVPGDTNGWLDVFVHDRQTGTTSRVSVATGGGQTRGLFIGLTSAMSADGRLVAFVSDADNLVPGDTNSSGDVFVHDRQTGTTSKVSGATGGGKANGRSRTPAISADGRVVAFRSAASNLVPGDTNSRDDVFLHDRQTGTTSRVSVATGGGQSTGNSGGPAVSADGRSVAFWSEATDLVPDKTNRFWDVYVHDRSPAAGGGSSPSDFDGDGKADLLWRNTSSGEVAVWLMNGTTRALSGFPAGVPLVWQIAGVGDVNGDGQADVIWRHSTSGTVAVWLMNGLTITSMGFPGSTSTDWEIEQIGDVDGNGTADLVWRNTNSGVVAVWLMNGTTIASTGFLGGVPAAWQLAGIGDVNADGQADVIWQHSLTGTVAVWLMNGLSITSVGFPGSTSTDWEIAGMGDVDGNGTSDVVWRNTNSGAVAVWLLNGTAIASTGFPGGLSLAWKLVQVGDMDGDGKADIIWRNTNSGAVTVWLMNGLTIASTGSPGSAPTDWEIQ